jgi:hypothetical protein
MAGKNLLILCGFVILGYLFFGQAQNNGFWHGDDFISLEHSLLMNEGAADAFSSHHPFKFQPLAYLVYFALFKFFLFDAKGYFIFNILLHGLNAFLVYMLVQTVLKDRTVALLSGVLFVFTVGNYGKSVMIVSGLEDLLITALTLLTMLCYFKNELDLGGRLFSGCFLLAVLSFIASMFTRSTSMAILGAFLAFNFFFRNETEKRVFNLNFVILFAVAVVSIIVKMRVFHYSPTFYEESPGVWRFIFYTFKNTINYLVRMVFPIHTSHLVEQAGALVRFVYRFATQIRIVIALTIVSYSFFGFIFGNRPIRFFIAWTYIMVLPFAFFQFPFDWLNIRHLYLSSVGFVVVISAGAVFCSRLIVHQRIRRFVPMIVPLAFILLSAFIVSQLDRSYEYKAASPATLEMKKDLSERHEKVTFDNGRLVYEE